MVPPFVIFADNQLLFSCLRIGRDLRYKPDIKLNIVQSLFPQDLFHLPMPLALDHYSIRVLRCFRQHFKGIPVRLPELIVQQALDAEALHSQRMQELPVSGCVLKPQQIFIPS